MERSAIAARSPHNLSPMHAKGLSLHVTFMKLNILSAVGRKHHGEILKRVAQVVEEGKLRPLVDSISFTFDEVSKADDYLESGKAIGKIVLSNKW